MSQRYEKKEDLSAPIIVTMPLHKAMVLQDVDDTYNAYLLRERESHGKRTVIKIGFEVYGRSNGGKITFNRFRNMGILLSCSNGRQAQLVMDTIEQVCKAMNGKHLAKAPDGQ